METKIIPFLNSFYLDPGMALLAGSIFLLLITMIVYFRKMMGLLNSPKINDMDSNQIRKWAEESEILLEKLSCMLEERKEIANRLIAELDRKIETLRSMKAEVDRKSLPIAEEIPGHQREGRVVEMAQEGQRLTEIARQTGLSVGEIQFIMNLRKCQESSPLKAG